MSPRAEDGVKRHDHGGAYTNLQLAGGHAGTRGYRQRQDAVSLGERASRISRLIGWAEAKPFWSWPIMFFAFYLMIWGVCQWAGIPFPQLTKWGL